MAGSGEHRRLRNESQAERDETQTPQGRLCDFCGESNSLLYCRADSAKLCFRCDREVHSTNLLFTKHTRNQLCDACDSKPASIHCSTENMVFCQNCDWDSHGGNSDHDRRPLEGFTGCPSASELSSILGFKDLGDKSLMSCGGGGGGCEDKNLMGSDLDVDWISDLLVWETPSVNSFDDLILSTDSSQNFHALDVPSLPKNRDTVCGKYKEAIVCQLREMLKLETNWKPDNEDGESLLPEPNFQPGFANNAVFEHDTKPIGCSVPENNGITWKGNPSETAVMIPIPSFSRTSTEEGSLVNDKTNDCGGNGDASDGHGMQSQHSIIREPVPFLSKFAPSELTSHNRESSLSRYKEKKKTRRYDKRIRYETRKARAESRTRIKGRFAKVVDQ